MAVWEILECDRQTRNAVNSYTVAGKTDESIIRHLRRSVVFAHFLYGEEESFVGIIILVKYISCFICLWFAQIYFMFYMFVVRSSHEHVLQRMFSDVQ